MTLLKVSDLTLSFSGLTAVNRVSFELQQNEILAVIGPNGAGKTSLFNMISGVYEPTSGQISFQNCALTERWNWRDGLSVLGIAIAVGAMTLLLSNAQVLWDAAIVQHYVYQQPFPWDVIPGALWQCLLSQPPLETLLPLIFGTIVGGLAANSLQCSGRKGPEVTVCHGIARTFQNIKLFPELSAVENVRVGMERHLTSGFISAVFRLPSYQRERESTISKAHELLTFVGLSNVADTNAAALPYGMQRRLEIARALATSPTLILLDEPAAGMNPTESEELLDLIRRIKARGITVLLIEHDMHVVMKISDRIVVLDHGEKIAEGTPEQVRCNPAVLEAYLGTGHAS